MPGDTSNYRGKDMNRDDAGLARLLTVLAVDERGKSAGGNKVRVWMRW